jgi:hypothetical protein
MNNDSDLYGDDIRLWSERQGALLRRLAAGEAVSDQIDWPYVVEEIEDLRRDDAQRPVQDEVAQVTARLAAAEAEVSALRARLDELTGKLTNRTRHRPGPGGNRGQSVGCYLNNAKCERLVNMGRSCGAACVGSTAQSGVQCGLSHFEPRCGFAHGQPFGDDGAGTVELLAGDDTLTPAFPTACCGRCKTSTGALLYQVALELTQCTEQVEDQSSARRRCVDRLRHGAEPDSTYRQRRHCLDQMWQRAAKAVELPDDQHVAVAHVLACRPQPGTIGPCP